MLIFFFKEEFAFINHILTDRECIFDYLMFIQLRAHAGTDS